MMQKLRLETKSGELIETIDYPGEGNEPDAIVKGDRVFIRRPMLHTQPPRKNSPETYFEASTWDPAELAPDPAPAAALKFAKVTETKPSITE